MFVLISIVTLWTIIKGIYNWIELGKPIIIISKSIIDWLSIFGGIILIYYITFTIRNEIFKGETSLYDITSWMFYIIGSMFFVFQGILGIRVYDKGILFPSGIILWEVIVDMVLEEDSNETITIYLRKRYYLQKEFPINVPISQQKELLDAFSKRNCNITIK
jgi:hypothetical protein